MENDKLRARAAKAQKRLRASGFADAVVVVEPGPDAIAIASRLTGPGGQPFELSFAKPITPHMEAMFFSAIDQFIEENKHVS